MRNPFQVARTILSGDGRSLHIFENVFRSSALLLSDGIVFLRSMMKRMEGTLCVCVYVCVCVCVRG